MKQCDRGSAIQIDVWSDIACPWCYIGKRNLEAGMAEYATDPAALKIAVRYHSFELDPDAPLETDASAEDDLARRKNIPRDQVRQMHDRVTQVAAAAGLTYDFETLRPARTTRAHQLVHHARSHGLEAEALERLFAAHFSEGRGIGNLDELVALGTEIGLEPAPLRAALTDDVHRAAVEADQQQAAAIGISGVPFYVLDGRYGMSGAQPPQAFAAALRQVAQEREGLASAPARA